MKPVLAFTLLAELAGLRAPAQTLGDVHLNTVPRTGQEQARFAAVIRPTSDFSRAEPFEALSGGAASVRPGKTRDAFSQPSGNMPFDRQMDFKLGNGLFYQAGCTDCHRPKFDTSRLKDQPEQSCQLIWPYTNLLLHDMGEGRADNRPEARATGREWRTAPLWGIGMTETVSGNTRFLHDGRARSFLEAILWHGGEAQAARDAVVRMTQADRNALVAFLESL